MAAAHNSNIQNNVEKDPFSFSWDGKASDLVFEKERSSEMFSSIQFTHLRD